MSCRVSIAVAVCLAIAGALSLSSRPGASTRDRDRVVRLTRSGSFRFDSPDAILHSHEETEPDADFSSLVIGQAAGATDASAASATPETSAAAEASTTFVLPRERGASTVIDLPAPPHPGASPPASRPPGRAPPFTA